MATPTAIVGYMALFVGGAFLFVFVNLLIGRYLRPDEPNEEKLEVYECGEPTIGSSFVQFDIRFYVVALLFIIFDVEIAFFFPWATVFGKAARLASEPAVAAEADGTARLTPAAAALVAELGVVQPTVESVLGSVSGADEAGAALDPAVANAAIQETGRKLAIASLADIGVFFAVLMVGFAYVWRRGDLDWVRAVSHQRRAMPGRAPPPIEEPERVVSA
ncbi:MAG: NADH-quinone oxidoreductase subunit A [Pirellulales bacterium]